MNLKEAFRYQNFLEELLNTAYREISDRDNAVRTQRLHKRNCVNPDAQDVSETVDKADGYSPAALMALMNKLVDERYTLSHAITLAKAALPSDIDATLDAVKFRRLAAQGLRNLLRNKPSKTVERGTDYKFNAEGNQTPYTYDVDVTVTEDFDRTSSKAAMKALLSDADKLSAQVEKAQLDAVVDYEPPFDINDGFDDVLSQFVDKTAAE